jgi:hypothetical protein
MTAQMSLQQSKLVARSLKITGSTRALSASVAGAVALNAAMAMQFVGFAGQMTLLVVFFVSVAGAASAISGDVCSRSMQTVSNLRSIGATSGSLSSALIISVLVYGIAGASLGTIAGTGLGGFLAGGGPSLPTLLVDFVEVAVAATVATALGVYVGVKATWRS